LTIGQALIGSDRISLHRESWFNAANRVRNWLIRAMETQWARIDVLAHAPKL